MLVELGNPKRVSPIDSFAPDAPAVTYLNLPDSLHVDEAGDETDVAHYGVSDDFDVAAIRQHFGEMRFDGVTHLPGHEALLSVIHPLSGLWPQHGHVDPSWVWAEDQRLADQIAEWYGIPVGRPDNVEDTHWTFHGRSLPPGVIPASMSPQLLTLNGGLDAQWLQMFSGAAQAGVAGTATATSATSLTGVAGMGTSKYINSWVVCTTTGVYGLILSHTDTVLTIDRWYNPATPGGAAGSTPGATEKYVILPSAPPAMFMGLSATAGESAAHTTLAGEITSAGGGLIRKICPVAHSAGASTGTLTPVFTANGSDTLPVTIAQVMVGSSIVAASAVGNRFEKSLGTTATLSLSGDQLTVTLTVTLS